LLGETTVAEELTNVSTDSETPAGQTQTNGNTTQEQQTPKQDAGKQTVNLRDLPEFKGYQEQFQRTVSHLNAELQQLKQERAQMQMSGMDDLEKANYLLQQKDQEIAQFRQAMQQQQIEVQRQADLAALSEQSGAPMSVLNVASTYDEAVKLTLAWMKDNGASKAEIAEAKREANQVDLGGGGAVTPQDRYTKERNELLKRGDTLSLFKQMLEE
jgi:predicted RNase H-like nuclease (RuvC/YqgF family)